MKEYIESIEKLSSEKINQVFYNSCELHALIVLKNIVKNADEYIETVCGNMCSEVNNDVEYLKFVDNYLSGNRERKFKILFDEYNDDFQNKPIAKTLAKYPGQVEIRKLKSQRILYQNKHVHFTVSDNRAFRLETDIKQKMAWGNFNDTEKALGFHTGFNKFFNDSFSDVVAIS